MLKWAGNEMVGVAGFEPATPASRRQCSTRLSYTPNRGGAYTQRLLAWQSPVDTGFAANTSGFPARCGFAGALAASRCSEPRCIKNKAELSTASQGWATGHAGASPSGKAAVFGTAIPRFESWRPSHSLSHPQSTPESRKNRHCKSWLLCNCI